MFNVLDDEHIRPVAFAIMKYNFMPSFETTKDVLKLYASDNSGTREQADERARGLKVWLGKYKMDNPDANIPLRVAYKFIPEAEMQEYLERTLKLYGLTPDLATDIVRSMENK